MFTADFISAAEAERIGLVNRVVPLDKLYPTAEELATKIARNHAKSIKMMKFLINKGMEMDFPSGMWLETYVTKRGAINIEPDPDREQRLQAFREGRMP